MFFESPVSVSQHRRLLLRRVASVAWWLYKPSKPLRASLLR